MIRKRALLIVLVGLATASAEPARADMIFTDQAAFLANVQPGSYLETFDSLPLGVPIPSPQTFSGSGFSYTARTEGFSVDDRFFTFGSVGDRWLSTVDGETSIVFNFTSGNVTAVGGFFFNTFFGDITPFSRFGTVTLTLDDGTTFSVTDTTDTTFVGFTTSSPIASLTVSVSGVEDPEDFLTVNDLYTGQAIQAVPEPSSLILAAAGLLGLLGYGVGSPFLFSLRDSSRISTSGS